MLHLHDYGYYMLLLFHKHQEINLETKIFFSTTN